MRCPLLQRHFESSLDFCVRYWVLLENSLAAGSQLHEAVYERLESDGIEIPFPQRDLIFRTVQPGAVPLPAGAQDADAANASPAEA